VTTITICCEGPVYCLSNSLRQANHKGEFAVSGSTLTRRHVRLLTSPLPLVVLFTMASTMANSQGISGKPTSVKPQPKVNAGAPSPGDDLSSQKRVRTDASRNSSKGPKSSGRADNDPNKSAGATTIEATQGTFRFGTGSQGKRYHIKTPYGGLDVGG
jgi:hypothetical protein